MLDVHVALQELQTVLLMKYSMAFGLPGKVVAVHLESNTAKVYICSQGVTVSLFISDTPATL